MYSALSSAVGLVVAFGVAVAWPQAEASPAQAQLGIVIGGVNVVDVREGSIVANQTVLIRGNRIESVEPSAKSEIPEGYLYVDGEGRFLMPALWDMHAHITAVTPLLDLPMYVAYGVTNVRDMLGCPREGDPFIACPDEKKAWSSDAEEGKRVGPRIFEAASFMANGPGMVDRLGNVPSFFDTANEQQAREFVEHFSTDSDSIKVYDNIPREAYFALAEAARELGLPLVGHKPRAISATEAARHQRSIEHARFLLHESFAGSEDLRSLAGTKEWREDRRAMVDQHDPVLLRQILEAMKENGTYYVPTHLTRWADAYADQSAVREDPVLEYLHPLMRMQWREDIDAVVSSDPSPDARRAYRDFYLKGLELTRQAHEAGVKVMVGSDYIGAGIDVHREMQQLVKAGMSPRDALVAATILPAEYAGVDADYGDVAAGKVADLILVDENPLLDIGNTTKINAVVFNGSLYDRATLDSLHETVRNRAKSWSVGAKIIWRFIRSPANY